MNEIERSEIDEMNAMHSRIHGSMMDTINVIIKLGERLCNKKASLTHGEWVPWVKANLAFTLRTAQNYMKVYRYRNKLKGKYATVSHLGDVYALLGEPTEGSRDPKIHEAIKNIENMIEDNEFNYDEYQKEQDERFFISLGGLLNLARNYKPELYQKVKSAVNENRIKDDRFEGLWTARDWIHHTLLINGISREEQKKEFCEITFRYCYEELFPNVPLGDYLNE